MPDRSKPEKRNQRPSEDIQVPPIPKQTAGAVTGAAIGSIAGPVGTVIGGRAEWKQAWRHAPRGASVQGQGGLGAPLTRTRDLCLTIYVYHNQKSGS